MHILEILTDEDLYDEIKITHLGDSGIDLFFPEEIVIQAGETKLVDLKIKCQMFDSEDNYNPISYDLRARSSIYKTPLRLANNTGIIDSGYRGEIMASVDNISNEDYMITPGQRLFQIVHPTLYPFNVDVVEELSETERGDGGFGSTGK